MEPEAALWIIPVVIVGIIAFSSLAMLLSQSIAPLIVSIIF